MEDATKNGLLLLMVGTLGSMASAVMGAVGTQDICLGAGGGLLSLAGFIIIIMGADEFGEVHKKHATWAVIFFVTSIVTAGAGIGMMVFGILSESPGLIIGGTVVAVLGVIVGGLANYFLLIDLENDIGRTLLTASVGVTIVLGVIVMIYVGAIFSNILDDIDKDADDKEFEDASKDAEKDFRQVGALGIIGQALLLAAIYIPYQRIVDGELQPVRPRWGPYPPMGGQQGGYGGGPPGAPPYQPCPECNAPMVFVHRYSRWFCERCRKYE